MIKIAELRRRKQKGIPGIKARDVALGRADKFEPVSCAGEVDHAEEADSQLVVARCDGAVDLLLAEHALDAVALFVERSVMLDLHPAI